MNMIVCSAAAAAAPALSRPALADAKADSIFALIERHRSETQAYGEALIEQGDLEDSLPEDVRRSPRVQYGMKDDQPFYVYSHDHIDRQLEWVPDFARTPKIRTDLHAEFDRDMAEVLLKKGQFGLTAADFRSEKLCHSCQDIAWEIATTVPTSMAGVAAVLQYANDWEDAGEEWPGTDEIGSDGWHYQFRQTLAKALAQLTL